MAQDKGKNQDYGLQGMKGAGPGHRRFGGPIQKPKDMKGTLVRLWGYLKLQKGLFIAAFVLVALGNLASLSAPYLIYRSIDTIAEGNGLERLRLILIALSSVYLVDSILSVLQGVLIARASQKVVLGLRRAVFTKLLKLPMFFYDTKSHGDLMSRLTNDVDSISTSLSGSAVQFMHAVMTVTGSFILMLSLSPVLTLGALITLPLSALATREVVRRTSKLFKLQQADLGALNGYMEESISGFEVLKSFGREEESLSQFTVVNERLKTVGLKAQIISGALMPAMNVISNLGYAVIAILGGILSYRGSISIGIIAGFLGYSRQFTRPITDIASIFNTLQSAVAGAERVFETIDEVEEANDADDAIRLDDAFGDVEFRNVSFSYKKGEPVIRDISFRCERGMTVALVGPTGAGKTTIVNLMNRSYEADSGSILIDGHSIRKIRRSDLRRLFGIVLQDTYLFSGTIRENIAYSRPDASMDDIIGAAKTADCHEFIMRLPKGYDTDLKESGSSLSEGERQLIAIARAVLSDPSIMILDEATSSVDTRTELRIQEAMKRIKSGRTSFMIAHRLSTIREADLILFIEDGTIAEQGTHEELMEKKGRYYRMHSIQYANIGEDV